MAPSTFPLLWSPSCLSRGLHLPEGKLPGCAWPPWPPPRRADGRGELQVTEEPSDTEMPASLPKVPQKACGRRAPAGWTEGDVAERPESLSQATEPARRLDEAPALSPTCRPEGWLSSPDSKGGSPPSLWLSLAAPGWEGALQPVRVGASAGHLGLIILKCWGLSTVQGIKGCPPPPLPAGMVGPSPEWS